MKYRIVLHSRELSDGSRPVYMRLADRGKVRLFPLNLYCHPKNWDKKRQRFGKGYSRQEEDNGLLLAIEGRAAAYIRDCKTFGRPVSFEQFGTAILASSNPVMQKTIASVVAEYAEKLHQDKRTNTALGYDALANQITAYAPNATLYDLSRHWLESFKDHLAKKGISGDSMSQRFFALKRVCRMLLRMPGVPDGFNPFFGFDMPHGAAGRSARALSLEELRAMENLPRNFHLDLFFLSFYLRGMNLADLLRLTPESIVSGRIEYQRRKTGKRYSVPVSPAVDAILSKYPPGPYLLPGLRAGMTEAKQRGSIAYITIQVNRAIISAAVSAGIDPARVTFYSARHTYATALKFRGVSVEVISEALGHSNLNTTQAYLSRFDPSVLDAADALLAG